MYVDRACRLVSNGQGYQVVTTITHQIYSQIDEEFIGTVISTGNYQHWLWFTEKVGSGCIWPTTGQAETASGAAEALIAAYEAIVTAPYREDE